MRSIIQSIFARHPVVVAGAVGFRWIGWLIAGHPFGLVIAFAALAVGLPVWYQTLTVIGLEVALALWGLAGLTTGAQALYLWGHLCRFRRRWPGRFARAYDGHRFFPVAARNYYSVPGGLRRILVAPQLSLLPRAFSYQSVGWILTPRADHDLPQLRLAVERVAAADDRIADIEIREVRGGRFALVVGFERVGAGRSGRFTTRLGELGGTADTGDIGGGGLAVLDNPPPPPVSQSGAGGNQGSGRSNYDAHIPGLQRFRFGHRPAPASTLHTIGVVAGQVDESPVFADGQGPLVGYGSTSPDFGSYDASETDWISGLSRGSEIGSNRWQRVPMRWSFSIIVPANLVVGTAALLSDTGPVAMVALCAGALISIILIFAEAIGG